MKSVTYTIKDPIGIHARPAGLLVKEAKKYESIITMSANGQSADVRKLMLIMQMAVKVGTEVTISAEGPDEETAIQGILEFFEDNL
ncbi:MAG: HPr family phosphocarrier protein [Lachnospiraceae bacterium]